MKRDAIVGLLALVAVAALCAGSYWTGYGNAYDEVFDRQIAMSNAASSSLPYIGLIDQGTAQSITENTLQLRSAATFADDEIVGATCVINIGTGDMQSRIVVDYSGRTDTAVMSAPWNPSGPASMPTYWCLM